MGGIVKSQTIIYLLMSALVIWAFYLILRRVGLVNSATENKTEKKLDEIKQEKELSEKLLNESDLFNPNLWKSAGSYSPMLIQTADQFAYDIYYSWGFWNDDEERIFNVFRQLPSQMSVSQVSDSYSKLFNQDLLSRLVKGLSKSELHNIYSIISIKKKI